MMVLTLEDAMNELLKQIRLAEGRKDPPFERAFDNLITANSLQLKASLLRCIEDTKKYPA